MVWLKVAGILMVCFLLLIFGFVEPARHADPGLVGVIGLLGAAVSGGVAFVWIRAVVRSDRAARRHDTP